MTEFVVLPATSMTNTLVNNCNESEEAIISTTNGVLVKSVFKPVMSTV